MDCIPRSIILDLTVARSRIMYSLILNIVTTEAIGDLHEFYVEWDVSAQTVFLIISIVYLLA